MFKKLGSNIIIYGVTNGIKSLVPFIMLPILTTYLSAKDYGILSLIEVTILFLAPFVSLNINSAINVEFFHLGKKRLSYYITNALLLSLISGVIFFSIFLLLQKQIAHLLNLDETLIVWLPVFALLRVVSSVVLGIYQVSNQPIKYAIYTITQTIIDFLLSYILVVWYKYGYIGRLEGVYFAFLAATVYGLIVLYQNGYIIKKITFLYSKKILAYGAPLIPHVIGGIIIAMSDRYFISYFIGNKAVGYYSVAYQMSSIMLLLSVSVNKAWTPMIYKLLTNYNQNKNIIFKYTKYLMLLYTVFALVLYFSSDFIFSILVDKKFYEAKKYFPILLIGFLFQSYYYLFTNFLFFYKKTTLLAKFTFISAILNLFLNFIFIKYFGVIGIAYATAITYVIYFFIVWYTSMNTLNKESVL